LASIGIPWNDVETDVEELVITGFIDIFIKFDLKKKLLFGIC
jgi:hypothetical protein